jgi:hypothetical protein
MIAVKGLLSPLRGSIRSLPVTRGLRAPRLPPATLSGPFGAVTPIPGPLLTVPALIADPDS